MPILSDSSKELIDQYNNNERCRERYNPEAAKVYEANRKLANPLDDCFEPFIMSGLRSFDMGRTMGEGFGQRLHLAIRSASGDPRVASFRALRLSEANLSEAGAGITFAYECFALAGTLHSEKRSNVAATKVLHCVFPELFLMLDRHVAMAFRVHHGDDPFTSSDYSAEHYLACLKTAQQEIQAFGVERFRSLEPGTPEARIFDKVAFILGRANERNRPKPERASIQSTFQRFTNDKPVQAEMSFWQAIFDLRMQNLIPRHWKRKDIHGHLVAMGFKPNTVNSVPANQSISLDGLVKGDYVKRGSAPKAFRIAAGIFELIDDPENRKPASV